MDLTKLFSSFTAYAFRIEVLPEYIVPDESEAVQRFRDGQPLGNDFNAEWVEIVAAARDRGASVQRLRLASHPLSFYERFETEAAYRPGMAAGELIRIYRRSDSKVAAADLWFFDGMWTAQMFYDGAGRFEHASVFEMNPDLSKILTQGLHEFEAAESVPLPPS